MEENICLASARDLSLANVRDAAFAMTVLHRFSIASKTSRSCCDFNGGNLRSVSSEVGVSHG